MSGPEKRYKGGYKTKVDRVKVFVFEKIQPLLSINLRKANDVEQEGIEYLELQNNPPKTVFVSLTKILTKNNTYIPFSNKYSNKKHPVISNNNSNKKGFKKVFFVREILTLINNNIGGVLFE